LPFDLLLVILAGMSFAELQRVLVIDLQSKTKTKQHWSKLTNPCNPGLSLPDMTPEWETARAYPDCHAGVVLPGLGGLLPAAPATHPDLHNPVPVVSA
jgi:hypothetical protein